MNSTDTVTPKQRRVIAFLLAERTFQDASRKAGISERQIRRWLGQPAFAKAYREAGRQAVREAITRLHQASAEAVENLRAIASDPELAAPSRVAASRATIELAFRGLEIEQTSELQELRAIVQRFEQMLIERDRGNGGGEAGW